METQTLKDLIKKPGEVAKTLGLSLQTVRTWLELNSIPPKHANSVAIALNMAMEKLLPYTRKTYKPVIVVPKTKEDLDALLNAYYGRPYMTQLPDRAVRAILTRWGDRLPIMYSALKQLEAGTLSLAEAGEMLGITRSAVNNLRNRYGMAPGPRQKRDKGLGAYKLKAAKASALSLDVIAGKKTAKSAADSGEVSLRTLHRYIGPALKPLTLNEISHWSSNFRLALAQETAEKGERHTILWRKWAESRGYSLKKKQKLNKPVEKWERATVQELAIAYLLGKQSLAEIASIRYQDQVLVLDLIKSELRSMGMSPLSKSIHHQAAVAEVIMARMENFKPRARA